VAVEPDLEIRPATADDLPGLLRLYGELAEARAESQPADVETAARILADVQADPRRELLVAVRDGRVLGTADTVIVPNVTHGAALLPAAPRQNRRSEGAAPAAI
jgi:hypothetical protein